MSLGFRFHKIDRNQLFRNFLGDAVPGKRPDDDGIGLDTIGFRAAQVEALALPGRG